LWLRSCCAVTTTTSCPFITYPFHGFRVFSYNSRRLSSCPTSNQSLQQVTGVLCSNTCSYPCRQSFHFLPNVCRLCLSLNVAPNSISFCVHNSPSHPDDPCNPSWILFHWEQASMIMKFAHSNESVA
jgi:hypothetical protein